MVPFNDILPMTSSFWEACARETNRKTCRTVQHIYLCDDCARRLTAEAFNGRPPIYHGETCTGYCALCNRRGSVTLRLWFACVICWGVILAYQKTFVASQAVLDFWSQGVQPRFPNLHCEETEVVQLLPYARGSKTKKQLAVDLATLDFLVTDANPSHHPVFHIELKTGPGSIDEMTEFQLDVNDSNDIIGAVQNTRLPAYIFHAQVVHSYEPPTRYSVPRRIWYTDIWTLRNLRKATRQRRGEDKEAGYYNTTAFRQIEEFVPRELETRRYEQLAAQIDLLGLD
jgi:hypothetical protein